MPNDSARPGQKVAMISSTSLDLPEHRQQAIDACLRQSIFPKAMEYLPARDADAIRVSTEMVDKADIYIGIYAWRYGHVPEGHDISITEMEFNRAVERGIPILVFIIHKDHPLTIEMVEADKAAQEKLKKLKERASQGRGRLEFKSSVELRSHIIQSLAALLAEEAAGSGEKRAPSFHPPNIIPAAPAPYIAHPYSLLQTREVVGRRAELNLLTDWVTANKQVPSDVRLFNVVAIGGMGKSALTWKWFNDIAPNELPHLTGRMWWSFYESDAYFENFIIRALAYTAGMPEAEVRQLPAPEREEQLWRLLDQQPFLLVLDGLERILLAYSRMDAAHLPDDDLDEQTANDIARFYGLPDDIKETYLEKHRLRQCADPRTGRFLRRLAQLHSSHVLISTRLYPAELQTNTALPLPGCYAYFIKGLTDDDALTLWREFISGERSGTSEQLLPLFRAFGNYPLLLRALAGEVAGYRPAPGDFDRWRRDHPDFNPAALPLKNAKTHVLEFALRGLGEAQRQVLHTIAAFRMPAAWDTLRAVLAGESKACRDNRVLDATLTGLEDRGLVGWDKAANRYDLHPIVRCVVWQTLDARARRDIYGDLHTYFDAVPKPSESEVESLEDLTPAIELFNALIGLERCEEASIVFREHIEKATHYRLSASRQQAALLERLLEALPRSISMRSQGYILNALARAYIISGEPARAAPLIQSSKQIFDLEEDVANAAVGLCNLSDSLRLTGHLREAEAAVSSALIICRNIKQRHQERKAECYRGITLAACGLAVGAETALRRSLAIAVTEEHHHSESISNAFLAQCYLWLGQPGESLPFASHAWELACIDRFERDCIRAARLHGEAALGVGDLDTASERLHHALTRTRTINHIAAESPALTALAELHRRQQQYDTARELLDQVWAPAERGPYPLLHADALNVLAQLERDQGRHDAAVAAATEAYQKAWCDGPPYAYHFGLTNARRHLRELGAPEPPMPPFDPSKFEPMPEVELNPKDEFYVEVDTEER